MDGKRRQNKGVDLSLKEFQSFVPQKKEKKKNLVFWYDRICSIYDFFTIKN